MSSAAEIASNGTASTLRSHCFRSEAADPRRSIKSDVSGLTGTVERTIALSSKTVNQKAYTPYTWVQGGTITIPTGQDGYHIEIYQYPRGGTPQRGFRGGFEMHGAMSASPRKGALTARKPERITTDRTSRRRVA